MKSILTAEENQLLNDFFQAASRLKEAGIVRSGRYLGDIGEFIANRLENVELSDNKRQKGYDGMFGSFKYEVKYANGSRKNIPAGDPHSYDYLIVIIGGESVLSESKIIGQYDVYKYDSATIIKNANSGKAGYTFAGKRSGLINRKYLIDTISLNENLLG